MRILTKGIFFMPLIAIACAAQISHAKKDDSIELSRSCLKTYSLAAGEADVELISLYSQLCDKKNKQDAEKQARLKIDIAQQYQSLGNNLKALQAVSQLRGQNIDTPQMTDIAFLAGAGIAQTALNQMRTAELRSLSEDVYPAAKNLADTIRFAQPVAQMNPDKIGTEAASKKKSAKKSSPAAAGGTARKSKPEIVKNTAPKALKVNKTVPVKEAAVKVSDSANTSPFETFNKK
jgi:hypothetical protein